MRSGRGHLAGMAEMAGMAGMAGMGGMAEMAEMAEMAGMAGLAGMAETAETAAGGEPIQSASVVRRVYVRRGEPGRMGAGPYRKPRG